MWDQPVRISVILNKEKDEYSWPKNCSNPRHKLHIAVRTFNNVSGYINVLWFNQHSQSAQAHRGVMIIAIKDGQPQIGCS